MSRIDEALRRASGGAAHGAVVPGPGAHLAPLNTSDSNSVLEYYPQEGEEAGPQIPAPKEPERLPVRPNAAPHGGRRRQFSRAESAYEGKLVVGRGAAPISVEQYRRLAGALHELQIQRGLKTLMVTSALPAEGKTLTVVNLALTLSESYGRRVLLIDADLRRPAVHQVLSLPNAAGLGDVLCSERGEIPLLEISPTLSVLPAGRSDSDPMAGLTSDRMRLLLEQSAVSFDWVLLDAAPVGFMPDAQLLAALTGAVLFVIGAGSTPYQFVNRAVAELGAQCIVGTVLNRVDEQNIPETAYYHQYYSSAECMTQ